VGIELFAHDLCRFECPPASPCSARFTAGVLLDAPPFPAVDKDAPIPRAVEAIGRILSRPVLGGLHHQCVRT
jgi:hypothetical protein